MCSTISLGKIFLHQKCMSSSTRAQVTLAPKQQSSGMRVFPELSKQGVPLADLRIQEIVRRQSPIHSLVMRQHLVCRKPQFHPLFLQEAYERCRKICAEYAKSFYLGSLTSLFPSFFFFALIYAALN